MLIFMDSIYFTLHYFFYLTLNLYARAEALVPGAFA